MLVVAFVVVVDVLAVAVAVAVVVVVVAVAVVVVVVVVVAVVVFVVVAVLVVVVVVVVDAVVVLHMASRFQTRRRLHGVFCVNMCACRGVCVILTHVCRPCCPQPRQQHAIPFIYLRGRKGPWLSIIPTSSHRV